MGGIRNVGDFCKKPAREGDRNHNGCQETSGNWKASKDMSLDKVSWI